MKEDLGLAVHSIPPEDTTFVDILRWRARQQPDQKAYTFLRDGETEEASLTYGELDDQVRFLGALLQSLDMKEERALLLYPPGLSYIVAFLSCLSAGVIAVPVYPPSSNRSLARIQAIVTDAQATIVLTTEQILSKMRRWSTNVPALEVLHWIATDDQLPIDSTAWSAPHLTGNGLAFLQYTSGSTGTPKGVMVSHQNLLCNSALLYERWQHTAQDVGVSWLPMFHDMGLIAGVLQPLYAGFPTVLMPPAAFLQRPLRWLQAISTYQGTSSCAPNFSYDLCARRVTPAELTHIDLSTWRVAVNGAEPVRAETLQRFSKTFAPSGFRPHVLTPGYGLAESTLMVACNTAGAIPVVKTFDKAALERHQIIDVPPTSHNALTLVGCGTTGAGHQIVIADPETGAKCPPGEVGEIWVAGASVAQGYWHRSEETSQTFDARIIDTGEGPFLRTGDLGFWYESELFITGRLKDTIIIRGRNLYPQDIELTVEQSHRALRPSCGAAFSVENSQEERLVIVHEVLREYKDGQDLDEVCQAIRQAISEQHEIEVYAVVLIRHGSIPKTSSGKIQRRACRSAFLADQLLALAKNLLEETALIESDESFTRAIILAAEREARRALVEAYLARQVSKVLRVYPFQVTSSLHLGVLGLDSLKAAELKNCIEFDLKIDISFADILRSPCINNIASWVLDQLTRDAVFSAPPLERLPGRPTASPLSFAQEQLWFLSQLESTSPFYNISFANRINGALHVEALQQSMNEIIQRHEVLRMSFGMEDGRPIQRINPAVPISLSPIDLAAFSVAEREAEVQRFALREACSPFDLAKDMPVRVSLLYLGNEEHVLLLTFHHIVFDGRSANVFARELFHLYDAFLLQKAPSLPDLPIRYIDYTYWQRKWLQGEVLADKLAYWQRQLTDLTFLDLPLDHPRPAVQTYQGATRYFTLPRKLVQALKHLSEQEGVTLFMLLFAAFQVLLMRSSGQEDIVVGTPSANRSHAELEDLLGFFVNTLVLRTDLSGNPTFRTLLSRVHDVCLEAYAHQDVPFTRIVEALQPDRDLSRNPLFQVLFIFQNIPAPELRLPDLTLLPIQMDNGTSKFDLTLTLEEKAGELKGEIEYNTDLFDDATISRLSQHYQMLLQGITSHPDSSIGQLLLLDEAEQHQILIEWNATRTSYPADRCLHQLFEEQVERTPQAAAMVFENRQLNYRDLNEQTNRVAHYLRAQGVTSGTLVGLCIERSCEMMIGLLGILKAGGAYVPLDPASPPERLAWMLENAQVHVLLSEEKLQETLFAEKEDFRCLCLDALDKELISQPATNLTNPVMPENPAYMIYTSGSTGSPKGVQIPHSAVVNLLTSMLREPGLSAEDTWLALTPLSFDIAGLELFLPLLVGARVVIAGSATVADGWRLAEALEYSHATIMQATPVTWRLLLATGWQGNDQLKGLCGGETLSLELARQLRPKVGSLWNMYGPTETTIWSTLCKIEIEDEIISIGRPIANTKTYVLDTQLQPVPVGVKGDLYIGGAGLAHGYLGQPDLTAERFLPNPLLDEPGCRFYRTGDLARYRADGTIECLGRADYQVKVRGFRIELGEIENTLERHPGVRTVVVTVDRQRVEDPRLVAYVVSAQMSAPPASELRHFLSRFLPDYMIPSAFIEMEVLPLTPSGKVDRHALPYPEWEHQGIQTFVAPRTQIEEIVAQIWEQVLNRKHVGVSDHFFAMGGHSLLAAQALSRICTALQIEVPLRLLFESPTVAEFSQALENRLRAEQNQQFLPLVASANADTFPLSFTQQRLWFLEQLAAGSPTYSIPVAVWLHGSLNITVLEQSLREMVKRHALLRATFASVDSQPIQLLTPHRDVALPVVSVSSYLVQEREEMALLLAQEEVQRPFDLTSGPVLRARLIAVDPLTHLFVLTMHHIVSDGWSARLFFQELGALYTAGIHDQPSPLLPLPFQYADYVFWQRQRWQEKSLERQLAYWKQQLQDLAVLELRTDHLRPAMQSYRGAVQRFVLPAELTQKLRELARQEDVTLFMTLLAAFDVLLMRYSGQHDLAVGTAVANRARPEFEDLVGFFVNTLVLRVKLSEALTFRALLHRVREVTLDAYAHQELPFERIVEELHPVRDPSRSPLFQVMFTMQPDPLEAFALHELELHPAELAGTTAKFDLSFMLVESKQAEIQGYAEYNVDLFDAATIARLVEHYQTLLETLTADADVAVVHIPLMQASERALVMFEWNGHQAEYLQDWCLHEIFEEQASSTPAVVAVVYESDLLTYGELDARANQVAHYLRSIGVGLESCVGICMERSLEMVVAILGILKAGGVYVPLDPSYPAERLAFMLEDARIKVLLTQDRLRPALPIEQAGIICLDKIERMLAQQPVSPVEHKEASANLAYVIYTSGSTGRPKGVCCSHAGVVNLLTDFACRKPLTAGDHCSLWTSVSFDVSVYEMFSALCAGGTLYLVPEAVRSQSAAFFEWLELHRIQSAYIPPFMIADLDRWLAQDAGKLVLERLLVGVEPIQEQLLLEISRQIPGLQIINGYGPTEATVCVTLYSVEPGSCFQRITPLGRPVQNIEIYLLDEHLQPTSIGVSGEIYIGGVGLARGYFDRPEITSTSFIPHPFSLLPGARLYKTGDMAYYLSDGNIQFLRRSDEQIKIRGFRVELGEIEEVLKQHSLVSDALVVTYDVAPGDKRIAAYVVPTRGQTLDQAELRDSLKRQLPYYMVPAALLCLKALPLTPSGKVDRQFLPAPVEVLPQPSSPGTQLTPIEEVLLGVWFEVLGRRNIHIHENFFDLGGHSLLATQLLSRIRLALQVEVPLRLFFEHPTVAEMAKVIASLYSERSGRQIPPLLPVPRSNALSLSFAQQRLWFLEQLEPESPFYTIPAAISLQGNLKVKQLELALQEVVKRHETLRTTIVQVDGQPVQVIADDLDVSLPVVDLSTLPVNAHERVVQDYMVQEAGHLFHLVNDRLWRVLLIKLAEQTHILFVTLHHIIADGWSLEVFLHELSAFYTAFAHKKPSPFPPLPIQYADYAFWQRQWLQEATQQQQLAYWRKQLADAPALQALPLDHARPAIQRYRGSVQMFRLSALLSANLRELSRREGTTLFMTLLAAFQVVLLRSSGQEDILIGTPVANRVHPDLEKLIGCFVNTLVLRTDLSGNPSFCKLLHRVRDVCLQAYMHQDVPFEQVVEALQPERHLSVHPLFQILFAWQQNPLTTLDWPGITLQMLNYESTTAKFDLSLFLLEEGMELRGYIEYNMDLFEQETIERMVEHFQCLLEGIVATPDADVRSLPIMTESERCCLLLEWNATQVSYPQRSLHALFEAQVERSPKATACWWGREQITYRELNIRANQLASYLRTLGVGPEVPVALCLHRSVEVVIGILAILKAGGIYLALDPAYPHSRLAFMLEDAQVPLLLTETALCDQLPPSQARCIYLDEIASTLTQEPTANGVERVYAENLAYIIYTSGSTGRPKGVAIAHRSAAALIHWASKVFTPQEIEGTLAGTSLCFDLSVFELFVPLCTGGCVLLAEHPLALSGLSAPVTLLNTVPSVVSELVRNQQIPATVKTINVAGEPLSASLVETLYALGTVSRVYNLYGPTEDTTYSTWAVMEKKMRREPAIGQPIENTQVYLLDATLNPVPLGAVGELYLGGEGLARGYLNRPELTAERFVPNPLSQEAGTRLYRTGDLARYRVDGQIEYIGRLDQQVKVRGFRIELGEIEVALRQLTRAQECVAVVRDDVPGGRSIVAYILPKPGQTIPEMQDLQKSLKQTLPDYMVPSFFMTLETLPLTPSGKIDRSNLPCPEQQRPDPIVTPRNALEEVVANIWKEVLGLEQVSVNDNFFALGGHSLLVTRIISQVRQHFHTEIPLRTIFETPTIVGLVQAIVSREAKPGLSERIAKLVLQVQGLSGDELRAVLLQKKKGSGNK